MTRETRIDHEDETCVVGGGTQATEQENAERAWASGDGAAVGGEGTRLPEGSRVGRYVVLETLGAGGMGVVMRAYDPKLRREVALKVMRVGAQLRGAEAEARMLREAQALAQLSDPHVVAVYDAERTEHGVCIAMEYVEGRTSSRWLAEQTRSWQEVLEVRNEVEDAVTHARRAVTLRETTASPSADLASARFVLARSLWAANRERSSALELAAQARDGYREAGPGLAESLAEVEAWLEAHAGSRWADSEASACASFEVCAQSYT
jgi:hypothetical protein